MAEMVWGRNPVIETLRSKRHVYRLLVLAGAHGNPIAAILKMAQQRHIPVEPVPRARLDELTHDGAHQGIVAMVAPRDYADVDDLLTIARERGEPPFLLMLDSIQDVHNLGSLIRTAEAVGVHGIILPEHRAAPITPAVEKSSAGAVEHLTIARVTNLTRTAENLKRQGIWIVGLAGEATLDFDYADLNRPLALVVGNEGKGISRLLREHCDMLIRIPMRGQINSLNAAVAGSIALYEAWRQRGRNRTDMMEMRSSHPRP
jgi:23S rRNA (guanosine2251-2'-O)-methyltransferase